jgi:hypothetical protein
MGLIFADKVAACQRNASLGFAAFLLTAPCVAPP